MACFLGQQFTGQFMHATNITKRILLTLNQSHSISDPWDARNIQQPPDSDVLCICHRHRIEDQEKLSYQSEILTDPCYHL